MQETQEIIVLSKASGVIPVEPKVDKFAVEKALEYIAENTGRFTVPELRDHLKSHGYVFGSPSELADFAEKAKVRYFIGRLVDKKGKRKYVATKEQLTLDFGNEYIYCKAELIKEESNEEKESIGWLRKHLIALIKRTPLLPQWASAEIIAAIEKVFKKMGQVA